MVDLAKKIAPSRSNILIQGESGTGKEVFARFIHGQSDRRKGPFIAVNCAAIPQGLVESELFGDTGAYASLGEKVLTRATTHASGPYEIEHVRADCYATYTNNPPAGAFPRLAD